MTDDPFKNRPEDYLNKGLKATIGALPIVGGSAAEFFNFVVGDPAQERRDDFLRGTFDRLVNLEGKFEELRPGRLRENEQFQATVIQAVRIASSTASNEKKRLLQNAIINSASGTIEETVRQILMRMLEDITPMHVVLLAFLDNPKDNPAAVAAASSMMTGAFSTIIERALPELNPNGAVFTRVSDELNQLGLTDSRSLSTMMTGGVGMLSSRTTSIGKTFLMFIREPEI